MALRSRSRLNQRGFAMLMAFAMAAAILVMLYIEMPRIIFQGQREKEQLLIDRGEQYKRAIQLYVRKYKKYPATMDEIEKTADSRFLRRKYKDPFTGKDDWRLVHVDMSGALTDSKVKKAPDPFQKDKDKDKEKIEGEPQTAGFVDPNAPVDPKELNAGQQLRASDRPALTAGQTLPGNVQSFDPNNPYDPNRPLEQVQNQTPTPPPPSPPQSFPGQSFPGVPFPAQTGVAQPGAFPQPGIFPQGAFPQPGTFPQQGGFPQPGQMPYPQAGAFPPGVPVVPGQQAGQPFNPFTQIMTGNRPASSQGGGQVPVPIPGQTGAGPNQAMDLIRQLLTTPRPGGQPGATAATAAGLGAGIAGIASKFEGKTIKVYAEREKYQEWEFIYDPKEDKSAQAATGQAGQLAGFGSQPGVGENRPGPGQPGQSPALQPMGGRPRQ